jgi:NCAIR mutase (PurE)-related protein
VNVVFDHDRAERVGLPEAVLCEGKPPAVLAALVLELAAAGRGPVLFTRLSSEALRELGPEPAALLDHDPLSRTAYLAGAWPLREGFRTAVITAGTADLSVAHEALRTLRFLGLPAMLVADVGVAGPWRLQQRLAEINAHDAIIVVAGCDAALATVMGSSTPRPVVAVPTSVGYGVARGGQAALNSMLSSCAAGVPVMNIDNGFGAACAVARIARLAGTRGAA